MAMTPLLPFDGKRRGRVELGYRRVGAKVARIKRGGAFGYVVSHDLGLGGASLA